MRKHLKVGSMCHSLYCQLIFLVNKIKMLP